MWMVKATRIMSLVVKWEEEDSDDTTHIDDSSSELFRYLNQNNFSYDEHYKISKIANVF